MPKRRNTLDDLLRRRPSGGVRQGFQPSQETNPGRMPIKPSAPSLPKDARRRRGPSRRYV